MHKHSRTVTKKHYYIQACTNTHTQTHTNTTEICINTDKYAKYPEICQAYSYTCKRTSTRIHKYQRIRPNVQSNICAHIHTYTNAQIHTDKAPNTCKYTKVRTQTKVHSCNQSVRSRANPHTNAQIHKYTQIRHIHINMQKYAQMHTNTSTNIHKCRNTIIVKSVQICTDSQKYATVNKYMQVC